jgi:F-type H+-transporting ATPase subunit a
MTTRRKVAIGLGLYFLVTLIVAVVFGWTRDDNEEFQPQNEFKLDTWIALPGPFDINKAVLYVVIAAALTVGTMVFVARRMAQRPNRLQTAVELAYTLMRDNITRGNMDKRMAAKWFPFIATLFLFIWFSNMVGYLPLPTNTEHKVDILGVSFPTFAIYAATANLSIPLVLALVVWIAYNIEGIRAKGPIGYLKSLVPAGVEGPMAGFIFILEFFSNVMRLMSLSVRLFANMLAGHLIILFMAGALAVLLGIAALGWLTFPAGVAIYLFEVGLVVTLQAFIFATLAAIYLGGAVAAEH